MNQNKKCFSKDTSKLKEFNLLEKNAQEIKPDQFFSRLLDTVEDAVWSGFPGQEIYYANSAFEKIFGKTISEFQAYPDLWINSVYPEDVQIAQDGNSELLLHGHSEKEYRISRPDGTIIWIHDKKYLIRENSGDIIQMGGVVRDITDDKEINFMLRAYQKSLRALTLELSMSEETEKRNIAVELHDNVIQNLALCKIKLKTLENESGSLPVTTSLREILSETIRTIRNLIYEISPPVVYDLNFAHTVESLAKNLIGKAGIKYQVYVDDELKSISQDMSIFLFQIVRELISNIIKHSQAKEVLIFLRNTTESIMIIVQDDGIGFNVEKVMATHQNSYGFFTIKERLNHIGGFLDIKSEPGKGTKANIVVPLSTMNDSPPPQ